MAGVWIRDYSPNKLVDIVGHDEQLEQLKTLVLSYRKGSKSIFLYGGTGNGKTSSVIALANDLNYELVELNASDVRKKRAITDLLGGVIGQASLFEASKIILVDEIEGLSGTSDRGGIPAIADIISKSSFPVILVGHNAHDRKFKALRKISELIEFGQPTTNEVTGILKSVCKKEKIEFDENALKQLARISGGDVRAAINDLQSACASGKKITSEILKSIGERNSTKKIEDALTRIFKATSAEIALGAFDDINEDLDKIFLWVEENIPREYLEYEHLRNAFDNLSLADVFYGRIRRWQYYRFYVYCYNLVTAGIALSKDKKYEKQTEYRETSRLLKIWMANMKNMKRKSIAQKVGRKTHTSTKHAFTDTIPFLKVMFQRDEHAAEALTKEFDLVQEEVEWLKK